MMRLPVLSRPTDFDYEHLYRMVDAFLEAGYTYFDTSYVYHEGKSEEATRKALVERHPRDNFTVATKFPTFLEIPEDKYIKNSFAEAEHVNLFNGLDKQTVIASDGTDLTELVEKAVAWLTENSF